ncbi:MAG: hypothetical protein WC975_14400 [Phycisphaerae bacterium]
MQENNAERLTNFALILDTFSYPLRGHGPFLIIGYLLCNLALDILKHVPFAGNFLIFPFLFFNTYVTAFIINVFTTSSEGDKDFPDWPSFTDWREEILQPVLLILVATFICFGPVIIYNFYNPKVFNSVASIPRYPSWIWIYLSVAIFYYPMGLLAVILHDSLFALNPYLV